MEKKYKFLFMLFMAIGLQAAAQSSFIMSEAYLTTTFNGQTINAKTDKCLIQVYESEGMIKVRIDFSNFRTGVDSTDEWLKKIQDRFFGFRGSFPSEQVLRLSQNNSMTFESSGMIGISNKHRQPYNVSMVVMNVGDNQNFTNTGVAFSRVRLAVNFTMDPREFDAYYHEHALTEPVHIVISTGRLNPYSATTEDIFRIH